MIHFILLDAPFLHPFRQVFSNINVVMHFGQLLAPFGFSFGSFRLVLVSILVALARIPASFWALLMQKKLLRRNAFGADPFWMNS